MPLSSSVIPEGGFSRAVSSPLIQKHSEQFRQSLRGPSLPEGAGFTPEYSRSDNDGYFT